MCLIDANGHVCISCQGKHITQFHCYNMKTPVPKPKWVNHQSAFLSNCSGLHPLCKATLQLTPFCTSLKNSHTRTLAHSLTHSALHPQACFSSPC